MNDLEQLLYWKNSKLTITAISNITGLTHDVLRYRYKKLNIKPYLTENKWDFSKIYSKDPDGLYVIGLLAADGYIESSGRGVSIWLRSPDIELIHRIIEILGSPDITIKRRSKGGNAHDLVGITIYSKPFVDYIGKEYGIVRCKSKTIPWPNNLVDPLSYVRGYFDGNGHAGLRVVLATASEDFLKGFLGWLETRYDIKPSVRLMGSNKSCYGITFASRKHVSFLEDMISIRGLERKTLGISNCLPKKKGIEVEDKKPLR